MKPRLGSDIATAIEHDELTRVDAFDSDGAFLRRRLPHRRPVQRMHFVPIMDNPNTESGSAPQAQSEPSSQAAQPRSDQPERPGRPRLGKTLRFARRHPVASVIGAAGVSLLGGAELAMGVVIGAGVAMLIERGPNGARRRVKQELKGAAEGVKGAAEGAAEGAKEEVKEVAESATEAAHTVRRRARHVIDTAPRTVKQRARAVFQAARGQISPMPPPGGEPPKPPASESAQTSAQTSAQASAQAPG